MEVDSYDTKNANRQQGARKYNKIFTRNVMTI